MIWGTFSYEFLREPSKSQRLRYGCSWGTGIFDHRRSKPATLGNLNMSMGNNYLLEVNHLQLEDFFHRPKKNTRDCSLLQFFGIHFLLIRTFCCNMPSINNTLQIRKEKTVLPCKDKAVHPRGIPTSGITMHNLSPAPLYRFMIIYICIMYIYILIHIYIYIQYISLYIYIYIYVHVPTRTCTSKHTWCNGM